MYRISIWTIIVGAVGIFIVAALLLMRRDVWAAAGKGPRWRRTLILCAITLLAAIGVIAAGTVEHVTCYAVMSTSHEKAAGLPELLGRLEWQAALLENYGQSGAIDTPTAKAAIGLCEQLAKAVEDEAARQSLLADEKNRCTSVLLRARKALVGLHSALGSRAASQPATGPVQ
ncbi:MAG: hypothetical protein ABFD92_14240 [Planctomycetaceae bacterium]|nr:hypothetical protein [Planctomycetaceae bacterium]